MSRKSLDLYVAAQEGYTCTSDSGKTPGAETEVQAIGLANVDFYRSELTQMTPISSRFPDRRN